VADNHREDPQGHCEAAKSHCHAAARQVMRSCSPSMSPLPLAWPLLSRYRYISEVRSMHMRFLMKYLEIVFLGIWTSILNLDVKVWLIWKVKSCVVFPTQCKLVLDFNIKLVLNLDIKVWLIWKVKSCVVFPTQCKLVLDFNIKLGLRLMVNNCVHELAWWRFIT
jgi:hypothetical protein